MITLAEEFLLKIVVSSCLIEGGYVVDVVPFLNLYMGDSVKKYHEMKEEAEDRLDLIIEQIKLREQIMEELDLFKQKLIQILEE